MRRLAVVVRPPVSLAVTVHVTLVGRPASVISSRIIRGNKIVDVSILFMELNLRLNKKTLLTRPNKSL